jgi:SAM-dependent methyltransferase
VLLRMLKNIAKGPTRDSPVDAEVLESSVRSVLNVGGNSKRIPIPSHYAGWRHVLLDIDPGEDVDLVQDARTLTELAPSQFDAIYCSHNLEHYYRHDGAKVLAGFRHVLKEGGFAEIRVPDIPAVVAAMGEGRMDIDDVLYTSPAGPIMIHDVLYGWGAQIERSGVEFFAHKQGFSRASLRAACARAGFSAVWMPPPTGVFEIRAVCFMSEPPSDMLNLLQLQDGDRL